MRRRIGVFLFLFLLLFGVLDGSGGEDRRAHKSSITRKRLIKELRDIGIQELLPCFPFNTTAEEIGVRLQPTNNLLEWHFSFTGIESSQYDGGVYHGRIILPKDYPRKAPMIAIMTPNGRWEVGKPICLSATAYHQETWDPSWNLRTLVMALRGHMMTYPREIGGIISTAEKKSLLAGASRHYFCPGCGMRHNDMLKPLEENEMQSLRDEGAKTQVQMLLSRTVSKKSLRNSNVHSNKKAALNKREGLNSNIKDNHQGGSELKVDTRSRHGSKLLGIKEIVKLLSPIIVMSIAFFVSFTYHSLSNAHNTNTNFDDVGVT